VLVLRWNTCGISASRASSGRWAADRQRLDIRIP